MRGRLIVVGEGPSRSACPCCGFKGQVHPLYGNPSRKLSIAAGWTMSWEDDKAHYKALYSRARLANLCRTHLYDGKDAATAADDLLRAYPEGVYVLLGTRVCRTFGVEPEWFEVVDLAGLTEATFCAIPHPSGLNRYWNDQDTWRRAGKVLTTLYDLGLHRWPEEDVEGA